jgi:hypothetical protein
MSSLLRVFEDIEVVPRVLWTRTRGSAATYMLM